MEARSQKPVENTSPGKPSDKFLLASGYWFLASLDVSEKHHPAQPHRAATAISPHSLLHVQ
jgi:hypothetical protein